MDPKPSSPNRPDQSPKVDDPLTVVSLRDSSRTLDRGRPVTASEESWSGSSIGQMVREIRALREAGDAKSETERVTGELSALLRVPSPIVQRLATRVLTKLGANSIPALTPLLHDPEVAVRVAACKALGSVGKVADSEGQALAIRLLGRVIRGGDPLVVRAGAIGLRVVGTPEAYDRALQIAAQIPVEQSYQLLGELGVTGASQLWPRTVQLLLERGVPLQSLTTELPALLAGIISPHWVAANLETGLAQSLGRRFGFIDETPIQQHEITVCQTLLRRIGICTTAMTAVALAEPTSELECLLDRWSKRKDEFAWSLLPIDVQGNRSCPLPLLGDDVRATVDQDILFAALREVDLTNLQIKGERSPFDSLAAAPIAGRFFFLSQAAFRTVYLRSYLESAKEIVGVEHEEGMHPLLPEIILALARTDTETRLHEWEEAYNSLTSYFRGRALIGAGPIATGVSEADRLNLDEPQERPWDDERQSSFRRPIDPVSRFAVLAPERIAAYESKLAGLRSTPEWAELLPGPRSVLALAAFGEEVDPSPEQRAREFLRREGSSDHLPSIGIEVQSAGIPAHLRYGWKAAFEYFGIPSRRRPEFQSVVEGSFRPSRSAFVQSEGLRLIRGVAFPNDQELAVHVSIGVDLGEEARFLALPLLLLNRAPIERTQDPERWEAGLRNLLSKGLLCRDGNCEVLTRTNSNKPIRSEIRIAPLGSGSSATSEQETLETIQLAAFAAHTAILADAGSPVDDRIVQCWHTFRSEVQSIVAGSPLPLTDFLNMNWYASTGDSSDLELFRRLPTVKLLVQLFSHSLENPEGRRVLESQFGEALRKLRIALTS